MTYNKEVIASLLDHTGFNYRSVRYNLNAMFLAF